MDVVVKWGVIVAFLLVCYWVWNKYVRKYAK